MPIENTPRGSNFRSMATRSSLKQVLGICILQLELCLNLIIIHL